MSLPEGIYYLKPVGSGKYLDVSGSCIRENGCQIQLYGIGRSVDNNRFVIKRIGASLLGGYTIESVANGKVIDADYHYTRFSGCKVQSWERKLFGLRDNQEWYIESFGMNKYRIKCVKDGLYLGVKKLGLNKNNTKVELGLKEDPAFEKNWVISLNR